VPAPCRRRGPAAGRRRRRDQRRRRRRGRAKGWSRRRIGRGRSPPLRGGPSLSQPSLSPPPPHLTGERGLKKPSSEGIPPSSPGRTGGRPGEEGRGDEGH